MRPAAESARRGEATWTTTASLPTGEPPASGAPPAVTRATRGAAAAAAPVEAGAGVAATAGAGQAPREPEGGVVARPPTRGGPAAALAAIVSAEVGARTGVGANKAELGAHPRPAAAAAARGAGRGAPSGATVGAAAAGRGKTETPAASGLGAGTGPARAAGTEGAGGSSTSDGVGRRAGREAEVKTVTAVVATTAARLLLAVGVTGRINRPRARAMGVVTVEKREAVNGGGAPGGVAVRLAA